MIVPVVNQNSTAEFEVRFSDEGGAPTTPSQVTWSVTNRKGEIVNGNDDKPVAADEVVSIVLTGDDLGLTALEAGPSVEELFDRFLIVKYSYTSSIGADLPGTSQTLFRVKRVFDIDFIT